MKKSHSLARRDRSVKFGGGDGRHLSLKEGLALVLGLQLIRGIPCHVVTPGVRTSEGGDGKESDKNESQELHCCLRKSD